jgi:hypothetical protein
MILPEGSGSKIFKSVLCVFFLSVLLSPVSEFSYDILSLKNSGSDITFDYSEKENLFIDVSEEYLKKEIIKSTEEILNRQGIVPEDISIKINIQENKNIDINDFVIIVSEEQNTEELAEKIFKKTGIEPEIILSGENRYG